MENKKVAGKIINDDFYDGNIFEEFSKLRKQQNALEVRTNPNSTPEEKEKAEEFLTQMKEFDKKIDDKIKKLG